MIQNETKFTIIKSLRQIFGTYNARGFRIKQILIDGLFQCIRKQIELQGVYVNITRRDENVPEVERYIRTVKERTEHL